MSEPNDWTDADFVSRDTPVPDSADERKRAEDYDRLEWIRREVRSRLMAGETQPQVSGWLVAEGLDPGAAARLVAWAAQADPLPLPTRQPGDAPVVLFVLSHQKGSDGRLLVNTDPVASARARAEARKERAAAAGTTEAPAPEFAFAQPADSAQAKLAHDSERSYTRLILAGILVLAVVAAAITVAVYF
jgi:hypothetical protein